jgi:hypothetical protein
VTVTCALASLTVQCPTISGTLVAGGVVRLRVARTMPSMMVMPMCRWKLNL